jgi:ribosomal-protein-alanine N-acetyltransferase
VAILETNRLLVRELESCDWSALEVILTDEVATRQMHFALWNDEKRSEWFRWCLDNARDPGRDALNWGVVLKDNGRLIGWLGIGTSSHSQIPGHRGMGYILSRTHWNQGYMTEAVGVVLGHEFGVLGSARVSANCETTNVGSARVMQKARMVFEKTATEPDFEGNVAERHYYSIDREAFLARNRCTTP